MKGLAKKPIREYEMKHRLTGAAIMIFTAVLVIPMLLSEPAIEASTSQTLNVVEDENFKSRIKPLNLDEQMEVFGEMNQATNKKALITKEEMKEKMAKRKELKQKRLKEQQEQNSNQGSSIVMTPESTSESEPKVETETKQTSTQQVAEETKVVNTESSEPEAVSSKITETTTEETTTSSSSSENSAITDGWAVRVGTFSKTENVATVSALLNESGFSAQTTSVKTNLGDAVRVWLGPYQSKDTAEKVSARLEALTGEKGYVTKHNT